METVNRVQNKSQIEQISKEIHAIDFGPILFQLCKKTDGPMWSRYRAEHGISLYRMYLILTKLFPEIALVPTKEIDEVWHCHILDTRKYLSDCNMFFGEFLHHFPYLGERGEKDRELLDKLFENTRDLFLKYFSINLEDSSHHRNEDSAMCSRGCSYCGDSLKSVKRWDIFKERPTL